MDEWIDGRMKDFKGKKEGRKKQTKVPINKQT